MVLNLWYMYHYWYLGPPLVVLRGVSPLYFNITVVLKRQTFSEFVHGVKRTRTTVLELYLSCKEKVPYGPEMHCNQLQI